MTPDEQKNLVRHHVDEHLLPEDLGKLAGKANVKAVVITSIYQRAPERVIIQATSPT